MAFRVSLKTTLTGYFAAAFAFAFAVTAANAQNLRVAPVFPWTSAFSLDLNILVPEGSGMSATQFPTYQACDAGQRSSAAQAILETQASSCPSWRFIMNPLIYPYYGTHTDSINGVYLSSGFTVTSTDCNGVTSAGGIDPGYSCNSGPVCPANWSQYWASSQPPTGTQGTRITGAVCYSNEPEYDSCSPDSNVGNPIEIGSKLKTANEIDLPLLGSLSLSRFYRSDRGHWVWNHQSKGLDTAGSIPNEACLMRYDRSGTQRCFKFAPSENTFGFALLRSDGRSRTFGGDTSYVAPSTVNDRVTKVAASDGSFLYFEVTDTDGNKERYGAAGALLAKQSRQGVLQNFTYNAIGQPINVADSFDRSVTFAYSAANGNIVSAADQTGATVLFGYDVANNLTSVTYPDGSIKQYLYNEQANTDGTDLSGTLTGIIDENGTRYATYKYDSERRAVSTEHAGGVEKYVASYTSAYGPRSVIDPLGTQRTYTFRNIEYVAKTTSITEACPSCGGTRSLAIAYDLNGNVSSRGDFNGNKTCSDYDLSRNLETARVEGVLATADCAAAMVGPPIRPDARKTTTTWHATYRLPLTITEVAAASSVGGTAGTKTTQFTYDASGNLLQKDVTPPKNDGTTATELRAWKWTYNALGQVLTAKDPLNQTTTTVYYAATDTAVPPKFTKGDVQTVTNALNHVVTFNEYDKNGRLLKMTDANGLITTMTYHPRGWLTSRSVANGATT
jgi:YD repeat-containing protein